MEKPARGSSVLVSVLCACLFFHYTADNVELFQETTEAKGDNSEQVATAERLLQELAAFTLTPQSAPESTSQV